MSHGIRRVAGCSLLCVILGTSTAAAQGGNAVINGTIFDQAKAVLPGVTVTATHEATGISREATTGTEGHYTIPTLTPGTYTVRAALGGFQTQQQTGLVLRIGQELTLDLTLSLAGVAESVTVSAEAPLIAIRDA